MPNHRGGSIVIVQAHRHTLTYAKPIALPGPLKWPAMIHSIVNFSLICSVVDALAVERDKYKVIATDLDSTFTEISGY